MHIIRKQKKSNTKMTGQIVFGECFLHENRVYMKLMRGGEAVNLSDGYVNDFPSGTEVVPLTATVTVEEES